MRPQTSSQPIPFLMRMKFHVTLAARHTAFASLRGALLLTVLASIAGAQTQTWIE